MKYFSAALNAFFDSKLKPTYQNSGTWPGDAIAVSDGLFNEFSKPAPFGKHRGVGLDGLPVWEDKAPASIISRRTTSKTAIDTAAGSARARYVSAGNLIEEEYRLALQQTQQWRAAGSPADSVPQAIQDWATASGITAEEAAVSIEQTAAAWETVLLTIRKLRLDGKVAVDNAADDADFAAIAQPYIDQLNAMQP